MLRPDHLGLAFRFLRTSRYLRQHQVAQQAGITPSMLSGYENGRKLPTLASLEKILVAMGCSLRDLVGALELVRDGKLGTGSEPEEEVGERSPVPLSPTNGAEWDLLSVARPPALRSARATAGLAPAFDLEMIFGAKPLAREEEEAFGEMLSGYCRWLRFLRRQASAHPELHQSREGEPLE